MILIRENNKNRGKVYRCFAIFNFDRQEFIHVQKRRCNKSYESTYQYVKDQVEKAFQTKSKQINYQNHYSEWFGILDQHQKCYFLFMLFPKSNIQIVNDALNQIIKLVSTTPNYYHLTAEALNQKIRTEIRQFLDKLENEYIEFYGRMGNPSDDETAGSKIIAFNPLKSNPQSSFRSNQQLQPSKNDTRDLILINYRDLIPTKSTEREYVEFGVYRGFAIYCIRYEKNIFQFRRGSKQEFSHSIKNIEQFFNLKSKQPQQNLLFIEKINSRAEWHGKYNKSDECYYLIMTFQNADPEKCNNTLNLAIRRFSKDPNFVQHSLQELNDKYFWDINNLLKSSERHYEYDIDQLGIPSDDEIIPKLDILKKVLWDQLIIIQLFQHPKENQFKCKSYQDLNYYNQEKLIQILLYKLKKQFYINLIMIQKIYYNILLSHLLLFYQLFLYIQFQNEKSIIYYIYIFIILLQWKQQLNYKYIQNNRETQTIRQRYCIIVIRL